MNFELKGVHFEVKDETREFVDKKIERIDYARDTIVDLLFTLTKERRDFKCEVNINFRWGVASHIKVRSFELHEGLDKLIDKIDQKVKKEKSKVQEHKGAAPTSEVAT
jgi:putative sigma-54 modulation protein